MKAFVINVNKCTGCYCCQIGCKDEHCGNDWTPYAKPQPEWGQFWIKLNEIERGQIPQVKVSYIPILCQHCVDAPCIQACPIEGALYTRDDGLVIIDPKKCTGCRNCIDVCPYDAIFYNDALALAQKCTGCAHILDRGWPITEPRCVDNCPHGAIVIGEESALSNSMVGSETLHSEYDLTTKVHYIGLPKRFVAGTVYDSTNNEVVIGATCTLTGIAGSAETTTDVFGDFWIEDLKEGDFTLTIASGSTSKTITGSTVDGDIGLGDVDING
jgi:Fe-S-cluster-containing dehydrogenase component